MTGGAGAYGPKQVWPAAERNKGPILEVLRQELTEPGTVLEVASGTGQHAVHFATHLPHLRWQPSDVDEANLASIEAWRRDATLDNLHAAIRLDVTERPWPLSTAVAAYNANMIHISPWRCAEGLMRGAGELLGPGGKLLVYGPFRIGGEHTAPSNAEFDEGLRRRDPEWGVRDLEAVVDLAGAVGFAHARTVTMPANNQLVCFLRR